MKRMVTFAIALGVGAALMAGCGSTQQGGQPQAFVTTAVTAVKAADQKQDAGKDKKVVADKNTAAAEEPEYKKTDAEWKFAKTGFSIKVPECIKNVKGHLVVDDAGQLDYLDEDIYMAGIMYDAVTDEEAAKRDAAIEEIMNGEKPDEEKLAKVVEDYFAKGGAPICEIIAYKDNLKIDDVLKKLDQKKAYFSEVREIGEKGSFKYAFFVRNKARYREGIEIMTDEYKAEVDKLFAEADSIVADITFTGPQTQGK